MTFVVIDYCKGNLRSVEKSLELAGAKTLVSADAAAIKKASALILPGVGSFTDASQTLFESGQMEALRERLQAGVPFLGICLGMQLLYEQGEEGMPEGKWAQGIGALKGSCVRVSSQDSQGKQYKIPHVGWNQVVYTPQALQNAHFEQLFGTIQDASYFYFTHSYQCKPLESNEVLAVTSHAEELPCTVGKDNIFGVQFHPEKSSHKGLLFMKNFVEFARKCG